MRTGPKSAQQDTDDLTVLFALSGSAFVKAARQNVGKIDPM